VGIGGGGGEGGYRWGLGMMKKKEGVKNVSGTRGWELCEKGWRLRGSCSLTAFFFPVRGCDDVRVDGWVALIFFLFFFGSDKCDGVGGWVGMGLWNAVGCEECTPLCFSAGGK